MSARIEDVAKAAGVSTATVSRVVNNDDHAVSAATRRKVEAAIRRLDYRPNIFARGLMKGATNSVGIIVPFLSNPYHIAIVDAIVQALAAHDVFVSICSSSDKTELERDAVSSLGQRRVDALIVIESPTFNSSPDATLDGFTLAGKPTILVNEHLSRITPHHVVRCAQEPGIRQALERFLEGGRRRVALFRGGSSYSFDLKETLFRGFVRDNGLDPLQCPIVRVRRANDALAVHDSARLVGELLRGGSAPQAVLACNDLIAIGAVQGALAVGARVPEDLAVIGVDNSVVSQFSHPPLSTVDLRMKTVGQAAARLFLKLREEGFRAARPVRQTLDARLVVRGSG